MVSLLITGGCRFIGSNFINYYFPLYKVKKLVNIDVMYYCASLNNISPSIREDPNYHFIKGNLCDGDRPFNDQRYYISNKKLLALGWYVKVDLLQGLKELCV